LQWPEIAVWVCFKVQVAPTGVSATVPSTFQTPETFSANAGRQMNINRQMSFFIGFLHFLEQLFAPATAAGKQALICDSRWREERP
jgi:hypothetical protein